MPEMWSIGYTRFAPEKPNAREEFYALALAEDSPEIQRFGTLACELDMAIGITYLQARPINRCRAMPLRSSTGMGRWRTPMPRCIQATSSPWRLQ